MFRIGLAALAAAFLLPACSGGGATPSSAPVASAQSSATESHSFSASRSFVIKTAKADSKFNVVQGYINTVNAEPSLVAFYPLNDTKSPMKEISGNNRAGIYNGTPLFLQGNLVTTNPPNSNSTSFASGYGQTPSIEPSGSAVSVECFIKPTTSDISQGAPRIFSNAWSDHSGNGYMLWINSGTIAFNAGWQNINATSGLIAGQVYHVTGTFDPNAVPTGRIYIGASLAGTQNGGGSNNLWVGDYGGKINIGALDASAGGFGITGYMTGPVSYCSVYNTALTPAQVVAHDNAATGGNATPPPAPTPTPVPSAPPTPFPVGTPIAITASSVCILGTQYAINHNSDGLPPTSAAPNGVGELEYAFDKTWWTRLRGNPIGGNQYSGPGPSWAPENFSSTFADPRLNSEGFANPVHDADNPYSWGPDPADGVNSLQIKAENFPSYLNGNPNIPANPYLSGAIDTPINQQYGFFVADVKTVTPAAGLSPAYWMLTNNGTPQGQHGPLNGEWDTQEQFGNDYGNGMNQGTLTWNSASGGDQNWGGAYPWQSGANGYGTIPETTTPSTAYHTWGVLLAPGGAPQNPNDYLSPGPGMTYGNQNVAAGATNYLDGYPVYGHVGGSDVTQGVSWKEYMAMFQVGGWLGSANLSPPYPTYYIRWIRAYYPTQTSCGGGNIVAPLKRSTRAKAAS